MYCYVFLQEEIYNLKKQATRKTKKKRKKENRRLLKMVLKATSIVVPLCSFLWLFFLTLFFQAGFYSRLLFNTLECFLPWRT